jgi:hypothetical protein
MVTNQNAFSLDTRKIIVDRAIREQLERICDPKVREAIVAHQTLTAASVCLSFRVEDKDLGSYLKAFTEQVVDTKRYPKVGRDGFSG